MTAPNPSGYAIRLTSQDSSTEYRIGKPLPQQYTSGILEVEWDMKYEGRVIGVGVTPSETAAGQGIANNPFTGRIGLQNDQVAFFACAGGSMVYQGTVTEGKWYHAYMKIDLDNGKAYYEVYDESGTKIGEYSHNLCQSAAGVLVLFVGQGNHTGLIDNVVARYNGTEILRWDFDDQPQDFNTYFGTGTYTYEPVGWAYSVDAKYKYFEKGKEVSFTITINPGGSTDTINISVSHGENIDVSVDKTQVTLDGSTPVTVTVTAIPRYFRCFTIKVVLQGTERTESEELYLFPDHTKAYSKILERYPESDETGWKAAGAIGGTITPDGRIYLVWRRRYGNTSRGKELVIAEFNPRTYEINIIKVWDVSIVGGYSFEEADLLYDPDTGEFILAFCYDTQPSAAAGAWRVRIIKANSIEELDPNNYVFDGSIGNCKDIVLIKHNGVYYMVIGQISTDLYKSTDLVNWTHVADVNGYHPSDLLILDDNIYYFYQTTGDIANGTVCVDIIDSLEPWKVKYTICPVYTAEYLTNDPNYTAFRYIEWIDKFLFAEVIDPEAVANGILGLDLRLYTSDPPSHVTDFTLTDSVTYSISHKLTHITDFTLTDSVSISVSRTISHSAEFTLTDNVSAELSQTKVHSAEFTLTDNVSYGASVEKRYSTDFTLTDNVTYSISVKKTHSTEFILTDNVSVVTLAHIT